MTRRTPLALTVALLAALAGARPAHAQGLGGKPPEAAEQPAAPPLDVDFEQKLGAKVPLDTPFRSETGTRVTLRECVGGRPTILVLAYLHCPHMCGEVQQGVLKAARAMPDFHVGRDYNVVVVSFDPKDTHRQAAAQRDFFVKHYGRPGAEGGLRFLTGEKRSIEELVTAVGFRFQFDKASKEFAHAAGVTILTPDGTVSKYFYGTEYVDKDDMGAPLDPPTAKELQAALTAAGGNRVGTPVEKFLQMCSRLLHVNGDKKTLMLVVRAGGVLTVLGLVAGVLWMVRRERRPAAAAAAAEQPAAGGV